MNAEQRQALIPELDHFAIKVKELRKELDYLIERYRIYQDRSPEGTAVLQAYNDASKLVSGLCETSDVLKRAGVDRIRSSVTSWYRDLHYDTRPLVEVSEEEITDPIFESITYNGNDTWIIIMTTLTHGRERVVVNSDAATWEQFSSVERL